MNYNCWYELILRFVFLIRWDRKLIIGGYNVKFCNKKNEILFINMLIIRYSFYSMC